MKRSRARRRIYIDPVFDLDFYLERHGRTQRFNAWAQNDSCRESIINAVWRDVLEDDDDLAATGRGNLTVGMQVAFPAAGRWGADNDYDLPLIPPGLKAVERLRQLADSPAERERLVELLEVATWIPAVLYSGSSAVAPGSSAVVRLTKPYADLVELRITLRHLTNTVLQHPALLSIVLGQARWALEEYARGRYATLNKQLRIKKSRTRLLRIAGGRYPLRDRLWVRQQMNRLIEASGTTPTLAYLERYPVSPRFGHELRKFFRQPKSETLYETWLKAKGDGPYNGMDQYGFYKWVRRTIPQAKNKLAKVERSQYANHPAYFINND